MPGKPLNKIDFLIVENSWLAKIAAYKLGCNSVAIVLGKTIYLHNTTQKEFMQNATWLKHELCHVAQFKKYGYARFIILYLWESICKGYHNNKFEIEARAAENL